MNTHDTWTKLGVAAVAIVLRIVPTGAPSGEANEAPAGAPEAADDRAHGKEIRGPPKRAGLTQNR